MFDELMTDRVTIESHDGTSYTDVSASVQRGKIFITRSDIPIRPGDRVIRRTPAGVEEVFIVDDPGFNNGLLGVPASYEMRVHRGDAAPKSIAPPTHSAADAAVDHLTRLANLRAFDAAVPARLSECAKAGEPLALVAFDIDKFKSVNDDNGGHLTGDEALVSIAQIAAACVKGKGTVYRLGGDEFAIVLPNHAAQEALAVAERVRRAVSAAPLTSHKLSITVSMGVAEFPGQGEEITTLRKAADAAAYDAKNIGRNLVRLFGEPRLAASSLQREPERRQPEPGGITDLQRHRIKTDHFRQGIAHCPHDGVVLNVQETDGLGAKTGGIYVSCRMCGFVDQIP